MFCGKCGNKNAEGTNFCTSCGNQLINSQNNNVINNNQNVQLSNNYNNVPVNNGYQQNQQMNSNYQQMSYQNKKVKTYWWVPVVLFCSGILLNLLKFVLKILTLNQNGEAATEGFMATLSSILGIVSILLWLLCPISVVVVIIMYATKSGKR